MYIFICTIFKKTSELDIWQSLWWTWLMNDGCASRRRLACVVNTPYMVYIYTTYMQSYYMFPFCSSIISLVLLRLASTPHHHCQLWSSDKLHCVICFVRSTINMIISYDNPAYPFWIRRICRDIFCSRRRHFFYFQPVDFETRVVHGLRVHTVFNLFDTTYTR